MRVAIWFFAALVASASLLASSVPAEARGTLIKGSLPSVYYLGDDDRRYAFPNERVFRSWYADFSDVETVDDAELADYPLGGNVTYRPGTRLVKLTNDPKVYAVEPGGVLRWVKTEAAARALYGDRWAERVDDLPDGFFPAYAMGEDLDGSAFPDGTLIDDGAARYVVWNGEAREMTEDGMERNGLRSEFAVSADASRLPAGARVSSAKEYLSDAAQLGLGERMVADVEGEAAAFDDRIASGAGGAVLGAFVVSVREKTEMSDPVVVIEARTNGDDDADAGGLVRGDGDDGQIEPNLFRVRLTDASGASLFGSESLASAESADGEQTVSFSGSVTLRPGRHRLFLVADVGDEVPDGEKYQTTFILSETGWDPAGYGEAVVEPESVESGTVTVVKGEISVSRDDAVESSSVLRGQSGSFDAVAFTFDSTLEGIAIIKRLALTAYVDAGEGDGDFEIGVDSDPGGTTSVVDFIDAVSVVRASDGKTLGVIRDIPADGIVAFEGIAWEVAPDAETEFLVRAELDPRAPFGLEPDRVAFDIASPDDLLVEDHRGEAVEIDADEPNGGTNPDVDVTVSASGSLRVEGEGEPEPVVVMGEVSVPLYALTLSAGDEEGVHVDTLSFRYVDQDAGRDVAAAYLWVDGEPRPGTANASGITFRALDLLVPAGEEVEAEVRVTVATLATGAVSGDTLGLAFEPSTLLASGILSGERFDADDLGGTVADDTEEGAEATVRRNRPVVTESAEEIDGEQEADDESELLRFEMGSSDDGRARLSRLAFKVEPDDVGTRGTRSDLLEKLAEVNGDARDDNDVAAFVDVTEDEELAEGSDGQIDFFIYDASEKTLDTTPSGLETASGDYGVIVLEFSTPYALFTTSREYAFRLRTIGMAGTDPDVRVTLLGGMDFVWTDGTSAAAIGYGDEVEGELPIEGERVKIE